MIEVETDRAELVPNSTRWRLFSFMLRWTGVRSASRAQDGILLVSRKASRVISYRDVRDISLRREWMETRKEKKQ